MADWLRIAEMIDFSAVYYTTQLVRCVFFSFVLTGIVLLLRRTFLSEQMFSSKRMLLKGMLWSSFLILPFLGKLKLFYENTVVLHATWWLTSGLAGNLWLDRIYMAGIAATAVHIFGKRCRIWKNAAGMEKITFENTHIYVTDMNITPFTIGLLHPKIVLPKVMLASYSEEELMVIVRHEQTHIRLGHLWFGFVWDILRCLLWVNPFLTICQKYIKTDMEDLCDQVCIQNSRKTAHAYGLVLLKTLKLLHSEPDGTPSAVTYAGEREFADIKRRIGNIAGFRPYKKRAYVGMAAAGLLALAAVLFMIHTHSYARCNANKDIMIGNYDGETKIVSVDTKVLSRMISYDDKYVYVEREVFERFLKEHDAHGQIWIVFDGFYKLPGLGGAAEACVYENISKESIVRIPYESIMDDWYLKLLQWL